MNKIAIITGANRGLGKAIADFILAQDDTIVVSISRSIHKDHVMFNEKRFHFIKTDLSKPFSVESFKILEMLNSHDSHIYFFNNASIILPINKVGNFNETEIINSININITFSVSLINYLIHSFNDRKLNFINITSGAANIAISFWALYSSSKAYMKMFFNILKEENKGVDNFSFFNFDPGTLDSGMQEEIRMNNFPDRDYFQNLKSNNELIKPEDAAKNILKGISFLS